MTPRLVIAIAAVAVGLAGCAGLWDGGIERDGHRRIYIYEVEPGDTIYRIAWRHRVKPEWIIEWNELDSPERLQVGQQLVLNPPAGFRPGARASATGSGGAATGRASSRSPEPPPPKAPPTYSLDWAWPARGEIVRSFGDGAAGGGKQGIEIAGEPGDTIRAAADGEVVYAGSGLRGYGNLVIIRHDERFLTAYGYNQRVLVDEGDRVAKGDHIADMGRATGADRASLHFELRIDGDAADPIEHLPPSG